MFSVRQYEFCLFNRHLNLNSSTVPLVFTAGDSSQEHLDSCSIESLKDGLENKIWQMISVAR